MDNNNIGNALGDEIDNKPQDHYSGSISTKWVKKNAVKILLGIIGVLTFSLLSVVSDWNKEHTLRMRQVKNLKWLAYQHRDVREKRDFYFDLTKDLNYYKFIKTVYEGEDNDFFETITIAYEESLRQKTSPWTTLSIMKMESAFKQYAASYCAYGLMQINYGFWKDEKNLTMQNIFDKWINIKTGLEIYNYYLKLAGGDKFLALFYYNNGTAMPPSKQNHNYAPGVMKSKYMKLSMNWQPINVEKEEGVF